MFNWATQGESMIVTMVTLAFVVGVALLIINLLLMKKNHNKEKLSVFECGFDPKNKPRAFMSMHFFMVTLIFLIFDIEITVIIPLPIINSFNTTFMCLHTVGFFMLILSLGTFHEWNLTSFEWKT